MNRLNLELSRESWELISLLLADHCELLQVQANGVALLKDEYIAKELQAEYYRSKAVWAKIVNEIEGV